MSLVTGKPVGSALVDRREPDEEMNGCAVGACPQRERSLGVHALREAQRHWIRPRARHGPPARYCVDLPWRTSAPRLTAVRLSLAKGGRSLELAKPGDTRLAVVDTTSFKVTAYAKP